MKEKLAIIGASIMIIGSCFGVYFWFEAKFAHSQDVQKMDQKIDKVDQKIDKSLKMMDYQFKVIQLKTKEDQIYTIEEKYGKVPKDSVIRGTSEKLKQEKDQILRELKTLEESK